MTKYVNNHTPYGPYERFIKRPLDFVLALLVIILLCWLYAIIAILVRIKLGSPVLFRQKRPGKDEKIFTLYKFRTMTDKRDKDGNLLPDDERLTKFGRALRKTSLDEIPEVCNILKGDMAIVGPRPLLIEYLPYYTDEEHHRHDIRPGLTGLAQVNGRNNLSWEQKFDNDLKYVKKVSFVIDWKIIIKTIVNVFTKKDIAVGKDFKQGKFIEQRNCG